MNRFMMNEIDQKKLDNFETALIGNHELMRDIRFLNTYLDDSGKKVLGRCLGLMYKQGYEDCIADIWEDVPKVNE